MLGTDQAHDKQMELRQFIRTDITASAIAHLSVLALIFLFTEVHPFGAVTAEPIAVDIVTPDEVPAKEPAKEPDPVPPPPQSVTAQEIVFVCSSPKRRQSSKSQVSIARAQHRLNMRWSSRSDSNLSPMHASEPTGEVPSVAEGPQRKRWSGRPDSNRRPPAPKAGALPGCATPRQTKSLF